MSSSSRVGRPVPRGACEEEDMVDAEQDVCVTAITANRANVPPATAPMTFDCQHPSHLLACLETALD
jgi:hypothetical protein